MPVSARQISPARAAAHLIVKFDPEMSTIREHLEPKVDAQGCHSVKCCTALLRVSRLAIDVNESVYGALIRGSRASPEPDSRSEAPSARRSVQGLGAGFRPPGVSHEGWAPCSRRPRTADEQPTHWRPSLMKMLDDESFLLEFAAASSKVTPHARAALRLTLLQIEIVSSATPPYSTSPIKSSARSRANPTMIRKGGFQRRRRSPEAAPVLEPTSAWSSTNATTHFAKTELVRSTSSSLARGGF